MDKLEIIMMNPDDLQPYFRNPRINDRTVMALVDLIPRIGFNVPIVVDQENIIIKGHSRWTASRILQLETVPVIVSSASELQNNKDRILDNAVHELTEWDYEMLKVEVEETGINLEDYKPKWVAKIIPPAPKKENRGDITFDIQCPDCGNVKTYNKKELLSK